jgi:hypothetical protein
MFRKTSNASVSSELQQYEFLKLLPSYTIRELPRSSMFKKAFACNGDHLFVFVSKNDVVSPQDLISTHRVCCSVSNRFRLNLFYFLLFIQNLLETFLNYVDNSSRENRYWFKFIFLIAQPILVLFERALQFFEIPGIIIRDQQKISMLELLKFI